MGRVSKKKDGGQVVKSKSKKPRSKVGGVKKRYEYRVDSIKFAHEVESFDFASELNQFLTNLGNEGHLVVSILSLGDARYHVVSAREVNRGSR